jgi:hypothetical protein
MSFAGADYSESNESIFASDGAKEVLATAAVTMFPGLT